MSITQLNEIAKNLALKYNFEVELPVDFGDWYLIGNRVNNVEFGGISLDVESLPEWVNYSKNTPSVIQNGEFSIRVMEGEDGATLNYFQNWFNAIVRKDVESERYGDFHFESNYKKVITIKLLKQNNDVWKILNIDGVFPKDFFKISLGFESSEVIMYDIQFSWDGLEIK